jgi:hypothetical protein
MSERLKRSSEGKPSRSPRSRFGEPSGVPLQEYQLTLAQRTETFFNQDVLILAAALKDRLIVSQENGKMLRVDTLEGWPKDKVGARYTKSSSNLRLAELNPGTLGIFPLPVRRMKQSLISAKSGEELGACVRLVRASRFDPDTNQFIPMPREGDIADFFELKDNEAVRLKFMDDSEILYFNKGDDNGVRVEIPISSTEQTKVEAANKYLRDLIGR